MYANDRQVRTAFASQTLAASSLWRNMWRMTRTIGAALGCFTASMALTLPTAYASEAHVPVFIAPADDSSLAASLFLQELERAFLDLGLTLTDPRAIVSNGNDAAAQPRKGSGFGHLARSLTQQKQKGLLIETSLSQIETQRLLPILRAVALPEGRLIASVASLDLAQDASRDELRIAAISLARRALRQMQDNSGDLDWAKGAAWASAEHEIRLKIENFNGCAQNYIVEEMETEFPGFVGIELVNATQSNYVEYRYRTTAKYQRLTKWLHIFFMEHQMVPERDFTMLYHQQTLRLILENGAKFGAGCNVS